MSNKTIAQQLNIKEFPFTIKDKNGNEIYNEYSNGFWVKREYDSNGKITYIENSDGLWLKYQFNQRGNETYYENSFGYWVKREYDSNGNIIYHETSHGYIRDDRPKVVELTLDEIAAKLNIPVEQLIIKK